MSTSERHEAASSGAGELPDEGAALDPRKTARTRRSYDRMARFYDPMEAIAERRYRPWREQLWSMVTGPYVLEIGVGTGKNLPYHPPGLAVTAIDLSPRMLERARRLAEREGLDVDLRQGDVQALEFEGKSFDEAVASFVFCSVPDPVLGLREVKRVLKPGGHLFVIEHVRAANALAGRAMDLLNPIAVRATGVNVNRRTAQNIASAGFTIERDDALGLRGIFRLIVARKDPDPSSHPPREDG